LVWGEESLELEKARGDLLGERAMAEAVGWVGGISQYCPNIALTMQADLIKKSDYCESLT
jgi:hypothetical protein